MCKHQHLSHRRRLLFQQEALRSVIVVRENPPFSLILDSSASSLHLLQCCRFLHLCHVYHRHHLLHKMTLKWLINSHLPFQKEALDSSDTMRGNGLFSLIIYRLASTQRYPLNHLFQQEFTPNVDAVTGNVQHGFIINRYVRSLS